MGTDLVEISPPFDPWAKPLGVGVNIMFELLYVLAESVGRREG